MNDTLGQRISEQLKKRSLTQKELAEEIGVQEATMSRYVNDIRVPKGDILAKIASVLHVTTDYLIGTEYTQDPERAFYKTLWLIRKNAGKWSGKHKADLVCMIFETKEGNEDERAIHQTAGTAGLPHGMVGRYGRERPVRA